MALFGSSRRVENERSQPVMGDGVPPAAPVVQSHTAPYGIAEVVRLMRGLPLDQNVELVVRVIKSTLETLSIRVPDIIDDASSKQKTIEERRALLEGEISELSKQIDSRRQEIERLQAELTEMTTAKERLQLAEGVVTNAASASQIAQIFPKTPPEA